MKASIIENQVVYGIDLSANGATVVEISDEEFEMVKSGKAIRDGEKIVPLEHEEPTEEQLDQEVLAIKKQEMISVIESKYSLQEQIYIVMNELGGGSNTGFSDMLDHVKGVFEEFKKNGKDSDFSTYVE